MFRGFRQSHFIIFIGALCLLGCMDEQSGRGGRPYVDDFSVIVETPTPEPTPTTPPIEKRPDGQIYVKSDFCACLNSKPDIINNCDAFCAPKNDTNATLYGNVTLGEEIVLNDKLNNLHDWCTVSFEDSAGPSCFLEVWDGSGTSQLNVTTSANSNSFTVNINNLSFNTTYVAKLVETQSGASSDSFQFIRATPKDPEDVIGPLKVAPVAQYTCLQRTYTQTGTATSLQILFDLSVRFHYYYITANMPPSLPPGNPSIICHDPFLHGDNDSPTFPRLELINEHMRIWDQQDPRFYKLQNPNKLDINQILQDRLLEEYDVTSDINIFVEFAWPNYPDTTGSSTAPRLGYIMQPWIEATSNKPYCPTSEQYNGQEPIMKLLGELVGVDTEAIYFAQREPVSFTDANGTVVAAPDDIIFVPESLVKKIWFYLDGSLPVVPTEDNIASKTVMFYWPPDVDTPYIRKSHQHIYTIRDAENIGSDPFQSSDRTSITPGDKRFGCIPRTDVYDD